MNNSISEQLSKDAKNALANLNRGNIASVRSLLQSLATGAYIGALKDLEAEPRPTLYAAATGIEEGIAGRFAGGPFRNAVEALGFGENCLVFEVKADGTKPVIAKDALLTALDAGEIGCNDIVDMAAPFLNDLYLAHASDDGKRAFKELLAMREHAYEILHQRHNRHSI